MAQNLGATDDIFRQQIYKKQKEMFCPTAYYYTDCASSDGKLQMPKIQADLKKHWTTKCSLPKSVNIKPINMTQPL